MSLAQQLNQTTVLTPRQLTAGEREKRKTPQQKAEDVIYTLNHTFTCLTLTDLFIVPILRGFGLNIGHSHDAHPEGRYGMNGGCDNPSHNHGASAKLGTKKTLFTDILKKPPLWQRIKNEIKHAFGHLKFDKEGAINWFKGELIGDAGAAVVTIPIQRYAPGLMDGIRRALEPVVGRFFKRSAERAANKWADKHGLEHDNAEVVARAKETYEYEMRHLPQMAVWTASSIGLHYGAMKWLEGKEMSLGKFARQKAATSGITAALVFGVRAFAPDKAHKWDETAGKHVVVPLTKTVGKLFGIEEKDVEEYHAKRSEMEGQDAPKSKASKVERQGTVAARVKEHASDAAASHASLIQQSISEPLVAGRA